jgi:hypothetical protein
LFVLVTVRTWPYFFVSVGELDAWWHEMGVTLGQALGVTVGPLESHVPTSSLNRKIQTHLSRPRRQTNFFVLVPRTADVDELRELIHKKREKALFRRIDAK